MKKQGLTLLAILWYVVIAWIVLYLVFKFFAGTALIPFDWILMILWVIVLLIMIFYLEGITILWMLWFILAAAIGSFLLLRLLSWMGFISKNPTDTIQSSADQARSNLVNDTNSTTDTNSAVTNRTSSTTVDTNSVWTTTVVTPTTTTTTTSSVPVTSQTVKTSSGTYEWGRRYDQRTTNTIDFGQAPLTSQDDGQINQVGENVIIIGDKVYRQQSQNRTQVLNGQLVMPSSVYVQPAPARVTAPAPRTTTRPCKTATSTVSCIPSGRNQISYNDFSTQLSLVSSFAPQTHQTPNGRTYTIVRSTKGFVFQRTDGTYGNLFFPAVKDVIEYLDLNNR